MQNMIHFGVKTETVDCEEYCIIFNHENEDIVMMGPVKNGRIEGMSLWIDPDPKNPSAVPLSLILPDMSGEDIAENVISKGKHEFPVIDRQIKEWGSFVSFLAPMIQGMATLGVSEEKFALFSLSWEATK